MKKIIALVLAIIMIAGLAQPIYAAEQEEEVSSVYVYEAPVLGVTPRFKIPKLPQVSWIRITPKLNFNIDFSAYIPKITLN